MLLFILPFLLLASSARCSILDEVLQYSNIDNHFAVTTPAEKADITTDELFKHYPSLKPETEEEVKELKRSFMRFLDMRKAQREEILTGSTTEHQVLSRMLRDYKPFAKKEFEELDEEDREYIGNLHDYIIHRLTTKAALKVIAQKYVDYAKEGWDEDTMYKMSWLYGASIAASWGLDPEKMAEEWAETIKRDEL